MLIYFDSVRRFFKLYIENKYNSTGMNQRSSHFNFGATSQNYGSVYAKDYGFKQPDPFRGNSLNVG